MKKSAFVLFVTCFILGTGYSQSRFYNTYGAEMLFSFAQIEDQGVEASSRMRWAPALNIHSYLNKDLSEQFGLFTGIAVRNVGYTYTNYFDEEAMKTYEKKFRSYNLGFPLGIKVGNLSEFFVFAAYELDIPFAYKEKTYDDGAKIRKDITWFSDRQQRFQHGVMAGFQLTTGAYVKFKYTFNEFHNQDYVDADGYKPYEGLKSNIFYVTMGFTMFRELYAKDEIGN
jgi:hypothetical protein